MALHTPDEQFRTLPQLPELYRDLCYELINQQPVAGLFGMIAYKNSSKLLLEQRLNIDIDKGTVVWPVHNSNFTLATEPGQCDIVLFRKQDSRER